MKRPPEKDKAGRASKEQKVQPPTEAPLYRIHYIAVVSSGFARCLIFISMTQSWQ